MVSMSAFTMPKWGIEMQEGTLAEWRVREGERFEKGQLLALIETDKITNEVEAEFAGALRKVVTPAGETRPVGALLAIFAEPDATDDEVADFARSFKAADTRMAAGGGAPVAAPRDAPTRAAIPDDVSMSPRARALAAERGADVSATIGSGRGGRITFQDVDQAAKPARPVTLRGVVNVNTSPIESLYASPLAKRLAAINSIDLSGMKGSGPRGRISKADVLARIAPVADVNGVEILPMSSLRKTIARRLTESKTTIPHFYLRAEVSVDALLALRKTANLVMGVKASVTDYLIRATALALVAAPDVNIQVHGADIHRFAHADISVAVANERGLVTPVLRAADQMSIPDIAQALRSLSERARGGRLAAQDIEGGTFTLSNLGMYGVDQFDAIINPPQGAILAIGTTRRVWCEGATGVGQFESRIGLSLSCDHRAIDGATGAGFLSALKALIESPERLIADG